MELSVHFELVDFVILKEIINERIRIYKVAFKLEIPIEGCVLEQIFNLFKDLTF